MKLIYLKILLFFILLNILVTSYHVNTNRKTYITTHHTQTTTSRVLSEKDIQSSIHDKDMDMKSVKENFHRQTSQRFEEYEEHMKEKRQKRKEERDKNIQKIIEEDKREKSLSEKIERGCLRCGCGLGGGVLPVWGLVSGIWYATLSQHATKLAIQKGIEAGIKEGLAQVLKIAHPSVSGQTFTTPTIEELAKMTIGISSDDVTLYGIIKYISNNIKVLGEAKEHELFYHTVKTMALQTSTKFNSGHELQAAAVTEAFEKYKAAEFAAKTGLLSNIIIASVVTILVIVLVMIIIYLVLRYRRKKKMKKKAQYTKLLNQ
ncbi:rifin PIR protein, putative [Plasmodium reichenowi]|uniref:Rifin n=1 Tax=Plasmodium reichenowi TaxID=5854 RepID=A0A060RMA6_PLARE|nr:rifin [Plasmodium reichenowi]SOV78693.1 rifin PIR protein, putative [Plasmodium reichenowi]